MNLSESDERRFRDRINKAAGYFRSQDPECTISGPDLRRWAEHKLALQSISKNFFECAYCGCLISPVEISFDHRYPLALGGRSTLENTAICCAPCNSAKRDLPDDCFEELLTLTNLWRKRFNEREPGLGDKIATQFVSNLVLTQHAYSKRRKKKG